MTLQEIKEYLFEKAGEMFDIRDDPDYTMDVNLFDYGFLDSLNATELTNFIEDHYHIEITQRDIVLHSMTTISEIAEVVAEKLS